MAQQISTNTFGVAKWIVSADATQGTHTTIAGAITSASSGDTIYIRDGSYTENLTLKVGVNLAAFPSNELAPRVTIIGNATLTTAGSVTISGIGLQTNGAALLTVSGSAASILNLVNCNINCSNFNGIIFSSSSSSAKINIENCYGDIGTTGITLFAHSSAGALSIEYTHITNSGSTVIASPQSAGTLSISHSQLFFPLNTSGSASVASITHSTIDNSATNTISVAHGSTSATFSNIFQSFISSGTNSALTVGASASLSVRTCTVSSSNTNPISGTGTITYSGISFTGTSNVINVTTQTGGLLQGGVVQAPSAGFIGEQIRATVASGSAVGLTTATPTNITSISLTAGIWDISSVCVFSGATTGTAIRLSISATSATEGTPGDNRIDFPFLSQAAQSLSLTIPSYRITLTATTTIYLVALMVYTVGTGTGYGRISATRVG